MEKMQTAINWLRAGIILTVASLFFTGDTQTGYLLLWIGFLLLPKTFKERTTYSIVAFMGFVLSFNDMDNVLVPMLRDYVFEFVIVLCLLSVLRQGASMLKLQKSQQAVSDKILYWFIASYIASAFILNVVDIIGLPFAIISVGCKVVGYTILLNNLGLLYRLLKERTVKPSAVVQ